MEPPDNPRGKHARARWDEDEEGSSSEYSYSDNEYGSESEGKLEETLEGKPPESDPVESKLEETLEGKLPDDNLGVETTGLFFSTAPEDLVKAANRRASGRGSSTTS